MLKVKKYLLENPMFTFYIIVIIISSILFATFEDPYSFELVVLGGITNLMCVFLAFGYGKIGGLVAVLSNLSGAVANLSLYFILNDTYFLPVSMFTLFNAVTCGVIAYLSSERVHKEKELVKLSRVDALTQVYNHRHFQNIYATVFETCKRKEQNLNVIAIDIDHFKLINDYFGHMIGDRVLIKVSEILKHSIRDKDLVFRYGGDEFIILLPDVSLQATLQVCERIQHEISKYADEKIEQSVKNYKISVSMGISNFPTHCNNETGLLAQADMALYDSKHLGRNKISVYDDAVESYLKDNQQVNDYLRSLLTLINSKDNYTFGHSLRVSDYCSRFAESLGMTDNEILDVKIIGLLHDIGKIEVPDDIISKDSSLSLDEYEQIKKHPIASSKILNSYISSKDIVEGVLEHHERYDGKGYPEGIEGDRISKYARIVSIVDAYDAMITDRIYTTAKSKDRAIGELENNSGKQFDPNYVSLFVDFIKENGHVQEDALIYNDQFNLS